MHEAAQALGGLSSPAGSCVWHVIGLQRSIRGMGAAPGLGGRLVRQEQAQRILVAALGVLAWHLGYRTRYEIGEPARYALGSVPAQSG